ncbi:MAG: phosphatidylinositol mannoside acyltransferase [Iamia sp.]
MPRPDLTYVAYRTGSALARALPARAVPAVAGVAGRLAARRMASRRLIVERNLHRVHGADLDDAALARAVDDTFTSYAHYWLESFRLPGTAAVDLDAKMRVVGMEHIEAGLDAGNGVVAALPHLGAWEWAAFWLTEVRRIPVTVVVEPIQPPELAQWFIGLREELGMKVITLGPSAGAACSRALNQNHILALLCDRDLGGGGIPVEMFGEATTLPGGPATLALRSGAPLVPTTVTFDIDGGHLGHVSPPLDTARRDGLRADVARVTQDLAGALEVLIRRAPDQWHLLQPNWPSDHEALAAAGFAPTPEPAPT